MAGSARGGVASPFELDCVACGLPGEFGFWVWWDLFFLEFGSWNLELRMGVLV